MKKLLALILGFSLAFANQEEIEKLLSKWNVKVQKVRDLGSLYEVVITGEPKILYFTKDLKYMLIGGLFDPKTGENLTAERIREISKVDVKELEELQSIEVSYGNNGKFYAFVDAECPYCHRFLRWAKEKGVSLKLFIFPVHDYSKNLYVLCEGINGKGKEVVEMMIEGKVPKKEKDLKLAMCEGILKKHVAKARELGVRGTPYIIAEDGTLIQGFLPQYLERHIKKGGN